MERLREPCVEFGTDPAAHKKCAAGRVSWPQKCSSTDGVRCTNTLAPLNFELREFDPMNGAGGRLPLLMDEFEKIGLQKPTVRNTHLFCRPRYQGLSLVTLRLRLLKC